MKKKKENATEKTPATKKPGMNIVLLVFVVLAVLSLMAVLYTKNNDILSGKSIEKTYPLTELSPNNLVPFPLPNPISGQEELAFDDFVGSEACLQCHKGQYQLWKNSTHGRAGGLPSSETVISHFDETVLYFKDAVVTLSINQKKEYLFTVKQDGHSKKVFRVDAVVGGGHMEGGGTQAYFSEFPDGTLRYLPFDFIKEENLWFCMAKSENGWMPISKKLFLDECVNWPPHRILGTEDNFDVPCQNCHGSQIQVKYDTRKKRYMTKYKSLTINCESCHGPGRRHIELAESSDFYELQEIGMEALSLQTKEESLNICFQCHAGKRQIENTDYLPGEELENHYVLKCAVERDRIHYSDGRIKTFAYQKGHLYSDCYLNGSLTCVDCHDPHSQRYRDINGVELKGRFSNRQCLGCHASKSLSPELHSHHKPDSPGNRCTSCHMPYMQHPLVGSLLRYARSDHTISIPRPEFDVLSGIENACQKCHMDKEVSWLQAKTDEWYGSLKPHKDLITGLFQVQGIVDAKTAGRRLLNSTDDHPIAQIAALSYFIENFLSPDMSYLEPEIVDKLKALSESKDIDLKALALMSLHFAHDQDRNVHSFLRSKLKLLGEEEFPIRSRWAINLYKSGLAYAGKGEIENSIISYKKALEIKPDYAMAYNDLGFALAEQGKIGEAIDYYLVALRIKPDHSKARNNLGLAFIEQQNVDEAVNHFSEALRMNPHDEDTHNNLGIALSRQGKIREAIFHYSEALQIKSDHAEAHYNLGAAWFSLDQNQKALDYFSKAYNIYLMKFGPDHLYTEQTHRWIKNIQKKMETE